MSADQFSGNVIDLGSVFGNTPLRINESLKRAINSFIQKGHEVQTKQFYDSHEKKTVVSASKTSKVAG